MLSAIPVRTAASGIVEQADDVGDRVAAGRVPAARIAREQRTRRRQAHHGRRIVVTERHDAIQAVSSRRSSTATARSSGSASPRRLARPAPPESVGQSRQDAITRRRGSASRARRGRERGLRVPGNRC